MANFTLTTGIDNISGGVVDDTFLATYNNGMTGTFAIGDTLNGNAGIDSLSITPIDVAAIAPPDSLWNNISNIEKIVINSTKQGAQNITTGAAFQSAFSGAGIGLTTTSDAGAITIDMSSFTGTVTLKALSTAGAQTITMGAGLATVTATSMAGAQTIVGVNLFKVDAISTDGGQTITSTGTNSVTVTAISNAGVQTIRTGAGADVITAKTTAATNRITAGGGNDRVTILASATGNYTVNGDGGNDVIIGGSGNDTLVGGDGNDTLTGGLGNDTLKGDLGTDRIIESGNVSFTLNNTTLTGLGTDTLTSLESATLTGGAGNNIIDARNFTLGTVTLNGEAGNDLLIGGSQNDFLNGGEGNDTLAAKAGNDNVNGGNGTDIVTERADVNFTLTNTTLTGLGTDTLTSIESSFLTGGAGNNIIDARNFTLGTVTLNGEAGNDLLIGGFQNDFLNGGEGNDTLAAKAGNDNVNGGNGTDIVTERADVNFTLTNTNLFGLGTDTLTSIESSFLTGGVGNNSFNALTFTLGSVTLNGEAGNDVLRGGFKNDILNGGDGNDGLRGAGNNNGVGSIDTLTGGAGNDTFYLSDSTTAFYNDGNNANAGLGDYALITDFSSTFDKIQLEGSASLYVLGSSPIAGVTGTAIYLDTNSNGAFNSTDELIAIVRGSSLNLASSSFLYV